MVPVTFENVRTASKQWARFILPWVTGKCNVHARVPTRNLPKSSKHFSSRTTHCIGLKSTCHTNASQFTQNVIVKLCFCNTVYNKHLY